ncbi:hypothetical protein [Bartonella sp. A05]|uniref:hypothetical protein n=1 Tax=Bartonella sp. A05 TaxID=2967261 RepID=UPI0022A9B470|nr:hypothetical protein [Bartonella sp. A05]MCZ2203696.1 hypothetical protein [Bartonella sp. A05]
MHHSNKRIAQDKQNKDAITHTLPHFLEKHNLNVQEVTIETSNPYFQQQAPESPSNPRTLLVKANAQSTPIARLYAKGHISQAQYKAAERFYIYWHQCQGDTQMSIDYSRQKVDGGRGHIHNIERQIDASNHLQAIKIQLGVLGYNLVERVVGHGQAVKDLSPSKRRQNSFADHLRDCLDLMATHWGYSNRTHAQ